MRNARQVTVGRQECTWVSVSGVNAMATLVTATQIQPGARIAEMAQQVGVSCC